MATATMDGTPRAMAAAARFARFHASRDTGACRPTSCLKLSGQTVRLWPHTTAWQRLLESRSTGDGGTTCAGAWIARPAPWRQRHASHGLMLDVTPGLSADQLLENECTICAPAGARNGTVCGSSLSRPFIVAGLALLHGWPASRHGGKGTLRTVSCRDTGAYKCTDWRRREHVTAAFAAAHRVAS